MNEYLQQGLPTQKQPMDVAQKVMLYCENYDDLVACLHRYVRAQSNMLDRWADSSDGVKRDLWTALHACEEPARAALERAERNK